MLQSLNKIRALQDPLKQFQCDFLISNTPGIWLAQKQQKLWGKVSGNKSVVDSETISLRCTSFSYPTPKVEQTETVIFGFRRKLGSIQNRSGIFKVKVTEQQDSGVLNLIQSWCDLIHNPMNGIRVPHTAYVSSAVVTMNGLKNKRKLVLNGFYPISFSVGEVGMSSSAPVEVDIEFNYDYYAELNFNLVSNIFG